LAALALAFVAFVIIYWIGALPAKLPAIVWSDPSNTISTVAILSTVTVLFLGELILTACNSLRWRFCTRQGGVSLLDFTVLSNVGPVGLSRILFTASDSPDNGTSRPHFWAGQR
jgi:hypothetical protein